MERELTLEEKTLLIEGHNCWNTYQIKDLNINSIWMSDGPLGLRKEEVIDEKGTKGTVLSTCFPASVNLASSFNTNLAYEVGKGIAKECIARNVDILLAPGVNIKRNPRCGRNFEYFSEDPLLSGIIGASYINGLHSENILATCKHYCLNNSENFRYTSNSVVDTRALREIYLKPFEIIIKNTDLKLMMCSYNVVNNIQVSENKYLLTDILRGQLDFNGLVMSDWGATKDRVLGLEAGLDLDMPGDCKYNRNLVFNAIKDNKLDEKILDNSVNNVLNLVKLVEENRINNKDKNKNINTIFNENKEVALKASLESAVLLKNDNNVLPLNLNNKYLVIGELFKKMRYQGAGSSLINAHSIVAPFEAFNNHHINYEYVDGYKLDNDEINSELENEAIKKANDYETILLFIGLDETIESEGYDRKNINLSKNQISLIEKLTKLNKHIVLVLYLGSQVIIPCENKIDSILNMYLPGMMGGEATIELLFGIVSPSGKLSSTWVNDEKYIPYNDEFGKTKTELYKESIFVGYRYYDFNVDYIQYPFGHGLSYSKFDYSNLRLNLDDNKINVTLNIKNIGNYKAKEVIQVYISNKTNKTYVAKKELKDFKKVELNINEEKEVSFNINQEDLAIFDAKSNKYILLNGLYEILIGSSSLDIRLNKEFNISSGIDDYKEELEESILNKYLNIKDNINNITNEDFKILSKVDPRPDNNQITLETPFIDFKNTKAGLRAYNLIFKIFKSEVSPKNKEKLDEEAIRKNNLFLTRMFDHNSPRSIMMASNGRTNMHQMKAIVDLANGRYTKAIKNFFY